MARFTVDTHLFRELGELLVGRDSTALVELIKNAYDADATLVTVHGENLGTAGDGQIVISDNGVGMTPGQFERGFLCIASRVKEEGDRRSRRFGRRYTGAKGVGRLAAHKLARFMQVYSIPDLLVNPAEAQSVSAAIDWDLVEARRTLAELEDSEALVVAPEVRPEGAESGTIMELQRLRREWTPSERSRLFWEVQTFQPAEALVRPPGASVDLPLLFDTPRAYDTAQGDPGFRVELTGDFEVGEEYWQSVVDAAFWLIEIDARQSDGQVLYRVTPTKRCREENPLADQRTYTIAHPSPEAGPFFQARILVREGSGNFRSAQSGWVGRNAGIRVYMEGFRVLPYGEAGDDWLQINADFKRIRTFRHLDAFGFPEGEVEEREAAYLFLRNDAYFGGVFLTQAQAPSLRMLVNREGFIPDAGYETLVGLVRSGTDLCVRHRAFAYRERREERRAQRQQRVTQKLGPSVSRMDLRKQVEGAVQRASELAAQAREEAATWQYDKAQELIESAVAEFSQAGEAASQLVSEPAVLRVAASVGLQMASFVHEMQAALGMVGRLEATMERIRKSGKYYPGSGTVMTRLHAHTGDVRRFIERQASYLTEITSADGQRRRSRQHLRERAEAGMAFVREAAGRLGIELINEVPEGLRSPAMFKSELSMVFTNLLTNAVKAAGKDGRIRVTGEANSDGTVAVRVENTGVSVDLATASRWFLPFQSTTAVADPVLGQGMGMGLPITRDLLEEYGSTIAFVEAGSEYATAIQVLFPAS